MRRAPLAVILVALAAGTATAGDDDELRVVRASGVLAGGRADVTVTLRFRASAAGRSAMELPLPPEAIVTGATVAAAGKVRALALEPAEAVATRMDALAGDAGATKPALWAFAITAAYGTLTLDAAVARASTVTVELTVSAPTCFWRDARYVELPAAWAAVLPAAQRAPAALHDALDAACHPDLGDAGWLRLPVAPLAHPVEVTGTLLPDGRAVVEVALASRLSDVPRDLATVILVDASRSMSPELLALQRRLVAQYLQAAPASRVQVVAVARAARPLLPGWRAARKAEAALDHALAQLAPANGTEIEAGLREAAAWLARVRGTRRVVVLTDGLLPARIAPMAASLARLVPAGTQVHVAELRDAAQPFAADDDRPLAPLAIATGGMAHVGGALGDATTLVRPTRLDALALAGHWDRSGGTRRDCSFDLGEGESCRLTLAPEDGGGPLVLNGMRWREAVSLPVLLAPAAARTAGLTPDHALFVTWGAPSAYEAPVRRGLYGVTCTGACAEGDVRAPASRPTAPRSDQPIETQLLAAVDACRAAAATAAIVELTYDEIIGVTVEAAAPATQRACIEAALWAATPSHPRSAAAAQVRLAIPAR